MIYTNGCSFTFGDELTSHDDAWPYLLAKKLNVGVFNDAVSGGTNYRTLYQTTKHIFNTFDLYIIAWTTNTRYTFYKSDNNFEINFNPHLKNDRYGDQYFYSNWGKVLYQHWHNELYSFKLWLQQIIHLQAILEKRKKNYLMINTMPNNLSNWLESKDRFIDSTKHLLNFDLMTDEQIFTEFQEINHYVSCIDTEKFYKWNKFSIIELTNSFPIGPGGHFLKQGHEHLANLLADYIQCLK